MKKGLKEGILNVVYALIDGTVAWFLWNNVSNCKVTWIQSIIICATIIGCCRSGTRMTSSDE
jgi:hypothetical protein